MSEIPILQDVTSDLQIKNPQVNVIIDRDKALPTESRPAGRGCPPAAYSPEQISTIYAPNNQYQVIMELDPRTKGTCTPLAPLHKILGQPARAAEYPYNVQPQCRAPDDQPLRPVPFGHGLVQSKPGASLGERLRSRDACSRLLPASITASFQGTAQAFSPMRGIWILLILAIVVIYIVLGILYESFIHPLTILSGLPSAGLGALVTLLIFRYGPEHLRFRRHYHADRYREEECHHDDRLCPGSSEKGR